MTLPQVSASTKIPVSKLRAIERDELESLPGGIFTRGFVRAYAEAVGLDSRETLAQFEARFPEESSVATLHATTAGRANEEFVERQRTAKGLIWFALLSAPLIAWLAVVMSGDPQPAEPDGTDAGQVEPSGASGSRPPLPSAPAPAVPPPAESAVPVDPPPVAPADAGQLTMEISPTADCWVVASADGTTLFSRLLQVGERQVIVAREAIDLRIGDAGAFGFTINQRPGRSLGAPGEVLNVRVTPSNYLSFVAE